MKVVSIVGVRLKANCLRVLIRTDGTLHNDTWVLHFLFDLLTAQIIRSCWYVCSRPFGALYMFSFIYIIYYQLYLSDSLLIIILLWLKQNTTKYNQHIIWRALWHFNLTDNHWSFLTVYPPIANSIRNISVECYHFSIFLCVKYRHTIVPQTVYMNV